MPTARTLIVRHGQTEWSKSGQYTSITDLSLTDAGVAQMRRTGIELFQNTKILKTGDLKYIFTSPRKRALQTIQLMLESLSDEEREKIKVIVDEDLREWEYGDYEGLLTKQIVELRQSRGLDKERPWLIWRDGCENGETTKQVGIRLSRVISRIQNLQRDSLKKKEAHDVLVFAHGHTLRYFAGLWFGLGVDVPKEDVTPYVKSFNDETVEVVESNNLQYLNRNPNFLLEAGGVGVLSYAHGSIDEPALDLAGAFTVPPEN